jgi:CheY-like chemotaxis protein
MSGKASGFLQFERKRVVIGGDDARIGLVPARVLNRYGRASHLASGTQALARITPVPPDVVLVDVNVNLSDTSALDFAGAVRQGGNRSIPIVAMTGSHIENPQRLPAGCNDA